MFITKDEKAIFQHDFIFLLATNGAVTYFPVNLFIYVI